MKVKPIIHDMNADVDNVGLECSGKNKDGKPCKRFLKGRQRGFYFERAGQSIDLRNTEWYCFQHRLSGDNKIWLDYIKTSGKK